MQPAHRYINADDLFVTPGGDCQKIACAAADLQNLFRRNFPFERAVVKGFQCPFGSLFAEHHAPNKFRAQIFRRDVAEAPVIFEQFFQFIFFQTGENDFRPLVIFLKIKIWSWKKAKLGNAILNKMFVVRGLASVMI